MKKTSSSSRTGLSRNSAGRKEPAKATFKASGAAEKTAPRQFPSWLRRMILRQLAAERKIRLRRAKAGLDGVEART
jgi:hypothetical protein